MKTFLVALFCFISVAFATTLNCRPQSGEVYIGAYPSNSGSTYAGLDVHFVVSADGNTLTETSQNDSTFVQWFIEDDVQLTVRDYAANPLNNQCPNDVVGSYETIWSKNCHTLTLRVLNDGCHARITQYDGIVLTNARKINTDNCGFYSEQVYTGFYPDVLNNAISNHPVTITFSADNRTSTVEVDHYAGITYLSQWTSPSVVNMTVSDLTSIPAGFNCDPTQVGSYSLSWAKNCKSVLVKVSSDACQGRLEAYNNLNLTRVEDFENIAASSSLQITFSVLIIAALAALF